jgi:hypothetical protein
MRPMNPGGLFLACVLLGAGVTVAAETQPLVLEGTRTDTAHHGGEWKHYVNVRNAYMVGATDKAIWYRKGGKIWRYNVEKQTVDVTTNPIEHLEMGFHWFGQVGADGSAIVTSRNVTLWWTESTGWVRLPQPGGIDNAGHPAIDRDGQPWTINNHRIFRWKDGQWQPGKSMPIILRMYPLEKGWFIWHQPRKEHQLKYTWHDHDLAKQTEYDKELWRYDFRGRFFRVGDLAIGQFHTTLADRSSGTSLCQITPTTIKPLITGHHVVLDLKTGQGLACSVDDQTNRLTINDGQTITTLPVPPGRFGTRQLLLRDGRGHYYHGAHRYDGRQWTAITPPRGFDFHDDIRAGLASGRLRYDAQKDNWVDAWPHLPKHAYAYDPDQRTAWVAVERTRQNWLLQHIRFNVDRTQQTLAEINITPTARSFPIPRFQDAAGNWWFGSQWRWDGKEIHRYDDGWCGRTSGEEGQPYLTQARDGSVWRYHTERLWQRFDHHTNRFENANPFKHFALNFAGKKYAIPGSALAHWNDERGDVGRLFEGEDGWLRAFLPIVPEGSLKRGNTFFEPGLFAVPGRSIRGDRMIVSCRLGVFEWDGTNDKWAYLLPFDDYAAYYDDAGRRVMVSKPHEGQIFIHTGKVFFQGQPIANHALLPAIDALIPAMNDDAWAVREQATAKLTNLARKDEHSVVAILTEKLKGDLPPEVGIRFRVVIRKLTVDKEQDVTSGREHPWRQRVGNSLLERMRKPLVPQFPGGYVIKPGMRYETARSIFHAAGANYASDLHNKHYPDLTYQGFVLPDGTCVYLRVTPRGDEPQRSYPSA